MPGRHCPYGLAAGFAARRVIAEWMEFYKERYAPLGVGSAGACGGLLRRGGLPPLDLQRGGRDGLTTGGYPVTYPCTV